LEKQMRAEREKRAVVLASEGQRDAAINAAEGDKQQVIKASEAKKQQNINEAEGQADAILSAATATAEGLRRVRSDSSAHRGAVHQGVRCAGEKRHFDDRSRQRRRHQLDDRLGDGRDESHRSAAHRLLTTDN
jgi:hypothetical protein